jgi:hypothetical protein
MSTELMQVAVSAAEAGAAVVEGLFRSAGLEVSEKLVLL